MRPTEHNHTFGHIDCPACEGYQTLKTLSVSLPFSVATEIWMENIAPYIKASTLRVYNQYRSTLCSYFKSCGDPMLGSIHIGNIRGYQQWRSQRACATRVNAEVDSVLKPILKEVNHWRNIADVYRKMPVLQKRVRQAMRAEQERRLIAVALDASKPRRLLAGHCLIVMANTGMGFGELRHVKREEVSLDAEVPYILANEGAKNKFRIRSIPLNSVALRSMRWIVHRWEDLGGTNPDQYILPHASKRTPEEKKAKGHRRQSPPDFTRPMAHIYRGARAILREAGLEGFVPYDMRSSAGTKLMTDPDLSEKSFEEIFGHSDTDTRTRYFAADMRKKAIAMEKIAVDPVPSRKLLVFHGGKK